MYLIYYIEVLVTKMKITFWVIEFKLKIIKYQELLLCFVLSYFFLGSRLLVWGLVLVVLEMNVLVAELEKNIDGSLSIKKLILE